MTKFTKQTASEAGKKSTRKGVPNKSTNEIREAYQMLVSKNLTKMSTWLNKVAKDDPAKALDIIHKFSDFLLPKLNRTEIEDVTTVEQILSMKPEERQKRIIELRSKLAANKKKNK